MMKRPNLVIAIDGPAASGKTTVASLLSTRLHLLSINTGAMYRAFALKVLRAGVAPDDTAQIEALLKTTQVSFERTTDGSTFVTLDGKDVSEEIKGQEVPEAASAIARLPAVRRYMVSQQRRIAARGGTVAEGRDTTTVVFPNAPFKFYIDASLDTRAQRRHKELLDRGIPVPLEQVREELRQRDAADRTRKISPLKKHPDAILIDSTDLAPQQVVDKMLEHLAPFLNEEAASGSATEG